MLDNSVLNIVSVLVGTTVALSLATATIMTTCKPTTSGTAPMRLSMMLKLLK
jgi:hypothetical protein